MYIVFSKTRFFFSEYIRILLNYTLRSFWFAEYHMTVCTIKKLAKKIPKKCFIILMFLKLDIYHGIYFAK